MSSHASVLALRTGLALLASVAVARAADAPPPALPAAATPTVTTAATASSGGLAALAGRWRVDLRPSPDDAPYDRPMALEIAADRSVRGSFYDSAIEAGRASASNGRTCFAFRTTDGVGPYHTSGCLIGDRILGQTWAEHRGFVLNWTAVRE